MKSTKYEIVVFLINGGLGYLCFAGSIELLFSVESLNRSLASVLAFLIAACVSYALHAFITFRISEKHDTRMPRFLLLQGFGAILSGVSLPVLVSSLALQPWVAATLFSLVWPLFSYPVMKFLVFR